MSEQCLASRRVLLAGAAFAVVGSNGVEAGESFNQLVAFRRLGGAWKIRSYMYASNRPGPGTPQ